MPIKHHHRLVLFIVLAPVILALTVSTGGAYTAAECRSCHQKDSGKSTLTIDIDAFEMSSHGNEVDCTGCHDRISDDEHMTLKSSGSVNCKQCHDRENTHGAALPDGNRPACHSCHTRHGILPRDDPRASTHPAALVTTCGRCHPAQTGRSDYLSWLPGLKIATHAKADAGGDFSRYRCLGCHQGKGSHGDKTIVDTAPCYQCHLTAEGRSPLWGYFHPKADLQKQPEIYLAGLFYQLMLIGLVGGGLVFCVRKFSGKI